MTKTKHFKNNGFWKISKYQKIYHWQCLAFCTTWNNVWYPQDETTPASSATSASNYIELQGQNYNENCQRISTCIFECITTCIYEITFNFTYFPSYTKWFKQLQHDWSPIIPKSGFFSQNITIFSMQQCNAQSHNPCNFYPKFSAGFCWNTHPTSAIHH